MEGLTLDLKELSEMCEQSLLVRSKPMQSRTWLQKWKKDGWMQLLFGRILKHSHGENFIKKWTSSVAASLVNLSAQQEKKEETKTLDTFGPILSKESENWESLPLFSSRMLRESSHQDSNPMIGQTQKGLMFCNMSSESWRDWVIKQRQEYLARAKSVHHTKGKEFLSLGLNWATPNTLDHLSSRSKKGLLKSVQKRRGRIAPANLREQVDLKTLQDWKILQDSMTQLSSQLTLWDVDNINMNGKHQEQSKNFPTPSANEHKARLQGNSQASKSLNAIMRGKLNPRWVEQIMGLPVGWVQVSSSNLMIIEQMSCDCSEMELFPTQPQKHSRLCGENWSIPPAIQRGDTLEVYLRRCIKRIKKGGSAFSPPLQVQVEAENKNIAIDFSGLDYTKDTEDLIKEIMRV